MAAPVRKDEEVELQVDSLAYGGNGVARLDGFVVFVRRGLPGDRVRARVTKVKRGFADALAVEVLEPSPHRVEAPCTHYPACGGCRFQDLAYDVQVAAKEEQVRDALKRIGGITDAPLEPILPAASQFFYRNKLEYSFTQTPSGPALGFHKAGRWDEVLEIEKCWLTTDLGNAIRNAVRDWARAEHLEAYDQAHQTGYLRHLVVREGRNTGQVLVMLVTARGERFERDELVDTLRRFPEVRSIHWAVNESPAEVTNLPSELLWGDEAIEEELLGLRFRIRPNAFLQTNTRVAERLYELARDAAALTGDETVYDLYCGTGTIGLTLARDALTVWGVEVKEESVACAIENAELNGIANAAFYAGEVGRSLEELAERAGPPDVVVVDPPRAGLSGKTVRRIGRLEPKRIVYVSCNPTTLAGNVKDFARDWGFELQRVTPVDMFPHTPHVEGSRCSRARTADSPVAALDRAPQQVGVHQQKGHREQRQRGQPDHVEGDGQHDREAERRGHREPRPEGPQPEPHRGGKEEREEQQVGKAEVGGRPLARDPERERKRGEDLGLLVDDVSGRAAPHGQRVDERDDRGDERNPEHRLEERQEPEADQRHRHELREVRECVQARQRQQQREDGESHRGERELPRPPEGQQEPHDGEHGRQQDEREPRHVPPQGGVPERLVDGVVRGEPSDEDRERAVASAQYGGRSAHQGPSALNAFQNRVFAGCSSRDSSMSGVTSAWTVGVNRWSSPAPCSIGLESGNSSLFTKPSARSPITTTSFGWTMCSSRVSQAAHSSSEPSANFRQFVPYTDSGSTPSRWSDFMIACPARPKNATPSWTSES